MQNIPDDPTAIEEYYKRGRHRFDAGELESALEDLMACLQYKPCKLRYSRLYSKIAAQLIARHYKVVAEEQKAHGWFTQAIQGYQQAIRLKINVKEFKRLMHQAKKLRTRLSTLYDQACELLAQEKHTKAKRKAVELLEQVPQCEEAQKLLRLITQREQAQELYAKGSQLYRTGCYEDARRVVKQSLNLNKEYSASQMLLDQINQELINNDNDLTMEPVKVIPLADSILLLEEDAEVYIKDKN
jgi:tetratricopeptide (TPR) repeat protein